MTEGTLETRFLDLPGGRLAYDDTGRGSPLAICVPGMGDLRSQFRILRPLLESLGLRVVTVDIRGTGESSASWPSYTPKDVAADVTALLYAMDAGSAVLAVNSMAAASGLCVAALQPHMVKALVLLGPVARDHPGSVLVRLAAWLGFRGPWGASAWASYYRSLYPSLDPSAVEARADLEEHVARLKTNLRERGRLAALRGYIRASKADCTETAGLVEAPVLAIMGSRDPDVPDPQDELSWLAEVVHAQTLLLDGIGHYPHVEAPGPTGSTIAEFLGPLLPEPSVPGPPEPTQTEVGGAPDPR